jgi:hypothetical protein
VPPPEKRQKGKANSMKSFVAAVAVMAVIGVGAYVVLQSLDHSAGNVYQTQNVRQ